MAHSQQYKFNLSIVTPPKYEQTRPRSKLSTSVTTWRNYNCLCVRRLFIVDIIFYYDFVITINTSTNELQLYRVIIHSLSTLNSRYFSYSIKENSAVMSVHSCSFSVIKTTARTVIIQSKTLLHSAHVMKPNIKQSIPIGSSFQFIF